MRFYAPSQARSVKDIAGFTKMKYRQDGQASKQDLVGKDVRADLEQRETQHFSKLSKEEFLSERDRDLKLLGSMDDGGGKEADLRREQIANPLDADVEDDSDGPSSDGVSDDESDSDDEAELLAELERIRAERAELAKAKEAEQAALEEEEARRMVAGGNPLLQDQLASDRNDFRMKRRWDDDVVFRNQAASEPAKRKQFINDTVRSDFHKKFMARYFT